MSSVKPERSGDNCCKEHLDDGDEVAARSCLTRQEKDAERNGQDAECLKESAHTEELCRSPDALPRFTGEVVVKAMVFSGDILGPKRSAEHDPALE